MPPLKAVNDQVRSESAPLLSSRVRMTALLSAGARFFAGDWSHLGRLLQELGLAHCYDLVLAAETVYSTDSFAPFLSIVEQVCCWSMVTGGPCASPC